MIPGDMAVLAREGEDEVTNNLQEAVARVPEEEANVLPEIGCIWISSPCFGQHYRSVGKTVDADYFMRRSAAVKASPTRRQWSACVKEAKDERSEDQPKSREL